MISQFVTRFFACVVVRFPHVVERVERKAGLLRPSLQEQLPVHIEGTETAVCTHIQNAAIISYRTCMKSSDIHGPTFCDLTLEEWQHVLGTIELAESSSYPKDITAVFIKQGTKKKITLLKVAFRLAAAAILI